MLAFFADHLLQTEYWPTRGPFYDGAVWGNLFVVPIAVVLGSFLWPPFRKRLHRFADRKLDAIHAKLDEHASHHEAHAQAFDEIRASLADLHRKHDALSAPERKVHGPSTKGPA